MVKKDIFSRRNTFARSLLNINENINFKKNQIMKTPLTLFFILFISLSFGQKNLVWHDNLEKALVISKKEKKPIMMFFTGSDWCGWCIRLQKEVFFKEDFKK